MAEGIHFLDACGPEGIRLYAIGDVHGRLDLLEKMHARIANEISRDKVADWRIIHLGDYVDRGPNSRGVIDFLIAACARDRRMITLAGNHDMGFLEFLVAPAKESLFMQCGGIETAASYDVRFGRLFRDLERFHADLALAMPPEHARFIHSCRFSVSFGDFFFCHAGIRPGVALDLQDPDHLIWIRNEFLDYPGLHPKVIVHGHTITDEPEVLANRVNVDTGAFRSGVLTALVVDGAQKRLITAEA
ncbi:metallophosphoesterase [Mesorhizobium sp. LHD-90]|uniref:metallophosphoesterase n=1 Tax=Mesorhizobium sp. LHD-90 TaxID=3071414 RepID=UPI0027DEE9CE|nr:metallophosphoesterase [Mesorhizobium sp. LHD-90]MDQ6435196.1 metallophosphoesterase [Mesorhizobium sp. LHD-90]